MRRWSCGTRDLPASSLIKAIHVYDFDNTLFKSPLPNTKLWTQSTVSFLQSQDTFANGGWWHDQHILEATGEGVAREESVAWHGWWNEHIVDLVMLSMEQDDALTVLLTGRAEKNFADIIKRITLSKKLEFDLICLKPQAGPNNQIFSSTMKYKQALLKELVQTYKDADEIRVYEDRPGHTKAFREFFDSFNRMIISPSAPTPRKQITAEVVQVAEIMTHLDPVIETAEVQRMINNHNLAVRAGTTNHTRRLEIKKNVIFTGYLVSPADTMKLLSLINLPSGIPESGLTFHGNSILITPRTPPPFILDKVGGMSHKQTWQVTGTACYESKIWAARVAPIPSSASYHTDNPLPIVVLAHLKNAKPIEANRIQIWQPVPQEKQYVFQTEVGEKKQLSVEREGEAEFESDQRPIKSFKRRLAGADESQHDRDHNSRSMQTSLQRQRSNGYGNEENRRTGTGGHSGNYRGSSQNRGRGGGGGGGGPGTGGGQHRLPPRSGRGGGGGGNRGGGGGNRGRGRSGYKSLDDVGGSGGGRYGSGQGGGGYQQPNYDDAPPHGGDSYNTAFPALGGGGRDFNSGMGASGGLPYGK